MDVNVWNGFFYGLKNINVSIASIFGMYSALHADLGRSSGPCFFCASAYFFFRQVIGPASQIFSQFAFGKGAKLAFEITYVGVINISIDHEAYRITIQFLSQCVGGLGYC